VGLAMMHRFPTRRKKMNMKQPAKPQPAAPANKAPNKPQQPPAQAPNQNKKTGK